MAPVHILLWSVVFWSLLRLLLNAQPPLLELNSGAALAFPAAADQRLGITPAGRKALAGQGNWCAALASGRWIGGVHLQPGHVWCWDPIANAVMKRT